MKRNRGRRGFAGSQGSAEYWLTGEAAAVARSVGRREREIERECVCERLFERGLAGGGLWPSALRSTLDLLRPSASQGAPSPSSTASSTQRASHLALSRYLFLDRHFCRRRRLLRAKSQLPSSNTRLCPRATAQSSPSRVQNASALRNLRPLSAPLTFSY